jgi:hypothetical protein
MMNRLALAVAVCGAIAGVGDGWAQTRTVSVCEQSVIYNVVPPANDVPAELRLFSGIWVGSWNNQLCSALIVEDLEKDGTVRGKYVFGSNPAWYINSPGTLALPGKISHRIATFRTNDAVIEYRLAAPDELAGTYTARRAPNSGSFRRLATSVMIPDTTNRSDGRQYLGDDQIRAKVVGRAFNWSNGTKVVYRSDGTVSYVNFDGNRGSGKFEVANGKLCVKYDHNRPTRCFLYFSDAKGLSVIIDSGETRRMTESAWSN